MARKPYLFSADLTARAAVLAKPHYCDNYHQHEPHIIVLRMAAWVGGGSETVRCPGHATDDTAANFQTCVDVHKS